MKEHKKSTQSIKDNNHESGWYIHQSKMPVLDSVTHKTECTTALLRCNPTGYKS